MLVFQLHFRGTLPGNFPQQLSTDLSPISPRHAHLRAGPDTERHMSSPIISQQCIATVYAPSPGRLELGLVVE